MPTSQAKAPDNKKTVSDMKPKAQAPEIEEESGEVPYDGPTHPLSGDLQVLSKAQTDKYLMCLKQAQAAAEKEGVDMKSLTEFQKTSTSIQFLTIYCNELEKQQTKNIRGEGGTEMAEKCRQLYMETFKKKSGLENGVQSGKYQLSDYYALIKMDYDKTLNMAKFCKKFTKDVPAVLKFLVAKVQIIDTEIKEIEAIMKEQN